MDAIRIPAGSYDLPSAAESLGVAQSTLRVQLAKGKLRGMRLLGRWVIEAAEVERYRRESLGRRIAGPGRPRKKIEGRI
jgi:predicted site-specific integrase-resolvase